MKSVSAFERWEYGIEEKKKKERKKNRESEDSRQSLVRGDAS